MGYPGLSRAYLKAKLNLLQQLPKDYPCLQFHAFPVFSPFKILWWLCIALRRILKLFSTAHFLSWLFSAPTTIETHTHLLTHLYTALQKTTQLFIALVKNPPKFLPFSIPSCPARAHVIFPQAISDLISYYSPPGSLFLFFWHNGYCLKDFVFLVSYTKVSCWLAFSSLSISAQNITSESGKPDVTNLT